MSKSLNSHRSEAKNKEDKQSFSDLVSKKIAGVALTTSILTINPEQGESKNIISEKNKQQTTEQIIFNTNENIKNTLKEKSIDDIYSEFDIKTYNNLDDRIRNRDTSLSEIEITSFLKKVKNTSNEYLGDKLHGDWERKIKNNIDEALKIYEEGLSKTNNSIQKAIFLNKIGICWKNKNKGDLAISKYQEALSTINQNNIKNEDSDNLKIKLLTNIGILHIQQGNTVEAKKQIEEALEESKKTKSNYKIGTIYLINISLLSIKENKEEIESKYKICEEIFIKENKKERLGELFEKMGIKYFDHALLINNEKEKKESFNAGIDYFKKSKKFYSKNRLNQINNNLGSIYTSMQSAKEKKEITSKENYKDSANKYLFETLEQSDDINEFTLDTYKNLIKNNASEKVKTYYEEAEKIINKLNKIEITKNSNELSEKYENEKLELDIAKEKEAKLKLWIAVIIASLVSLIAITQTVLKNKQKKLTEDANKDLSNKNKELENNKKELEKNKTELEESQEILKLVASKLEILVDKKTKEIQAKNIILEESDRKKAESMGLISHNLGTLVGQVSQVSDHLEIFIPDNIKKLNWFNEIKELLNSSILPDITDEDIDWYQTFKEINIKPLKEVSTRLKEIFHLIQLSLELQNKVRPVVRVDNSPSLIKTILSFKAKEYNNCNISLDLIESDELFKIDESLLEELLKIIISNSIKFSKSEYSKRKENKTPEIEIKTTEDNDNVYISFSDQGCGFPEKALKNFGQQLESGQPLLNVKEGLGLGLFIAKLIMTEHNGTISAKNNNNSGATVTLTFPKNKKTDDKEYITNNSNQIDLSNDLKEYLRNDLKEYLSNDLKEYLRNDDNEEKDITSDLKTYLKENKETNDNNEEKNQIT